MNTLTMIVALGLSLVTAGAGLLLLPLAKRNERAALRVRNIHRRAPHQSREPQKKSFVGAQLLGKIGAIVIDSGVLSRSAISDLEQTVAASGNRASTAVALFVGIKFVMFLGLPLLAWLAIGTTGVKIPIPIAMIALGVVGLMLPDFFVRWRRKRYLKTVDAGMPAGLDLLIMCAEAGLSLEAGLERVSVDAKIAAPGTANEFRLTANEMKMLPDRRQALANFGVRTKLDSAVRMGSALSQSLKYGTPIVQALRVLSAEMRQAELTRFEERAARIPVLLTIPMILFILPCIFVVVGGPAALRIMQTFMHK
jgi:tight adherence protein C